MLWSAIAGDMARAGRNQTTAAKLLEEIATSLGNPLKWSGAARAMGVGSNNTAREYGEFLSEIPAQLKPGARRAPEDGLVENIVAVAMFRSAGQSLTQADPAPGAVGYWRSSNNRELDFVVPAQSRGRGGRMPIEVKGDNESGIARSRLAIARAFGEGVVASRTVFDPDGDVPVIPIPIVLAALAETPMRHSPVG